MKKVMILFAALALTACGASNNSANKGAEVETTTETTTTTTDSCCEGDATKVDSTKCEGCTGDCATCPNAGGEACNCKKEEAK